MFFGRSSCGTIPMLSWMSFPHTWCGMWVSSMGSSWCGCLDHFPSRSLISSASATKWEGSFGLHDLRANWLTDRPLLGVTSVTWEANDRVKHKEGNQGKSPLLSRELLLNNGLPRDVPIMEEFATEEPLAKRRKKNEGHNSVFKYPGVISSLLHLWLLTLNLKKGPDFGDDDYNSYLWVTPRQ